MKEAIEIQMESDRKMPIDPVIGTQILDNNIPSQLNFQREQNPEEVTPSAKSTLALRQYNIRGKGIFDMDPKYKQNEVIPAKGKAFPVKAYNDQGRGLRTLWEAVVGYSKKQLIVEDGYLYVTNSAKNSNIVHHSLKLNNLIKIFVDSEDKVIRLVFRDGSKSSKRINKDYQLDDVQSLMDKILLECNVIGLAVSEDEVN